WHARPAVRARRGVSGPEGGPEHAAFAGRARDDREQGRLRAAGVQRLGHGLQHRARELSRHSRREALRIRDRGVSRDRRRAEARGARGLVRLTPASAARALDFFERQDRARRTSRMLVVAFAVSFAAVVAATTALVGFFVYVFSDGTMPLDASLGFGAWALEHRGLLGVVALGTLGLLVAASTYRAASLAGGGGPVARMLGGTEVPGDATDLARKRLLNVVEEMAIASG